jgi:hypothetical protein
LRKRDATSTVLEFRMHSDELLRAGVRRLLHATPDKPAGEPARRREVARLAGCSPDNLYQVAAATLLPSGVPRSVGRELRLKLDETFPGWLDGLGEEEEAGPAAASTGAPSLREALQTIRDRLSQAGSDTSEHVGEALKLMAKVPDSDRAIEHALTLLNSIR